jgi:hypothetical protein
MLVASLAKKDKLRYVYLSVLQSVLRIRYPSAYISDIPPLSRLFPIGVSAARTVTRRKERVLQDLAR